MSRLKSTEKNKSNKTITKNEIINNLFLIKNNIGLNTEIIYLQPGNYKLEFRYDGIKETIKTIEKRFIILPKTATNIRF